jgi:hypothetical protein
MYQIDGIFIVGVVAIVVVVIVGVIGGIVGAVREIFQLIRVDPQLVVGLHPPKVIALGQFDEAR